MKISIKQHLSSAVWITKDKLKKGFLITATAATLISSLQSCNVKERSTGKGTPQEQLASDSALTKFREIYVPFLKTNKVAESINRDGLYVIERWENYTIYILNGQNTLSRKVTKIFDDGTVWFTHELDVWELRYAWWKDELTASEKATWYNDIIKAIENHNQIHIK